MEDESMENIGGLHGANVVARALSPPSAASLSAAHPTSSVFSSIVVKAMMTKKLDASFKGCIQPIQVTFQPSLFLDQSPLLGSSNLDLNRVIDKIGGVYTLQDRLKEFGYKLEDDQFEKLEREFSTRLITANDLGESEDPYGIRLLLMGDELMIVDKNLLRPVNEVMDVKDPYRYRLLVMGNHLSDLKFKDTSLPFFNEYTLNEAPELVVVVTLLKELDASKKLSTLVEGESLMNDGTSIVVYQLFYRMVLGQNCSWNLIIEFLVKVSLAAVDTIIVFGITSILWLGFIFNETVIEITLTLVSYVVYFNGQEGIEVYGVLIVMTLGMFCVAVAKITFKGATTILGSDALIDLLEVFSRMVVFVCTFLTKDELVGTLHSCMPATCDRTKQSIEGVILSVIEFVTLRGIELSDTVVSRTSQYLLSAARQICVSKRDPAKGENLSFLPETQLEDEMLQAVVFALTSFFRGGGKIGDLAVGPSYFTFSVALYYNLEVVIALLSLVDMNHCVHSDLHLRHSYKLDVFDPGGIKLACIDMETVLLVDLWFLTIVDNEELLVVHTSFSIKANRAWGHIWSNHRKREGLVLILEDKDYFE